MTARSSWAPRCSGLAIGIPAYGGFLLMTRAAYALGDSRTPAIASLGSAIVGAAGMVVAGQVADGSTRLALIGGAHSVAYAARRSLAGAPHAAPRRVGARPGAPPSAGARRSVWPWWPGA